MLSIDPHARSFMWDDLEQGRNTEINEFQGEIIKMRDQFKPQTPLNQRVMAKIREAETHANGSPQLQPDDI